MSDIQNMMSDIQTQVDELKAQVAALLAQQPAPREIVPCWGERTCQTCGVLADVIDVERPSGHPPHAWNGEGYCMAHATALGVLDREHLQRT